MDNFKKIEEAKAFLKSKGYYTDNLWSVEDVKSKFNCTEEQAQDVLDGALTNDATMGQIWFAIGIIGEDEGLEEGENN